MIRKIPAPAPSNYHHRHRPSLIPENQADMLNFWAQILPFNRHIPIVNSDRSPKFPYQSNNIFFRPGPYPPPSPPPSCLPAAPVTLASLTSINPRPNNPSQWQYRREKFRYGKDGVAAVVWWNGGEGNDILSCSLSIWLSSIVLSSFFLFSKN